VRIGIQMCEKAVELDPGFALAYARLSTAHAGMYWFHYDRSEERLSLAKQSVDTALQLNPNLPEAHIALGYYYYWGHLDYDRALEQFAIARKSQPNNSELLQGIGFVQRRQGKFEKAAATLAKALELDPRSTQIASNLGETFLLLRKYRQAERYFDRAILLTPDWPRPYAWKAQLYLLWEGNTEKARAVLEQASQNIGSLEDSFIVLWSVSVDAFDGKYQEALARLSSCTLEVFESQFYFIPKTQLYSQINGLMGNQQLEHDYYESARKILETKVQERPEDAHFHSALGIAYAGLGRKEDAIREGKLAVELLPVSKEAYGGLFRLEDLAQIYVMVGEFDAAIDQLRFLLSVPGRLSIPFVRREPTWGPLRDHPRFRMLVEEEEKAK